MKLAFIGFGVAGYGLSRGLKGAGIEEIYFFDNHWEKPPFQEVLRKHAMDVGAIPAGSIRELVEKTDKIISCVPGSISLSIAEQTAPYLGKGHLFIDVSTTSPMVKEKIESVIGRTGAAFVDAAMMGAIPTFLHKVPILASGSGAIRFKEVMEPYQMQITYLGEKAGKASALKMLRSIFMKGLVALLIEMLMATHHYQADDMILQSISETMDQAPFRETARMIFSKGIVSAERMAHEMDEVVETLEFFNLPSDMTKAVQEKLLWCSHLGLREKFGGDIPESLDQALRALAEGVSRAKS